jgi:hypothetical protein
MVAASALSAGRRALSTMDCSVLALSAPTKPCRFCSSLPVTASAPKKVPATATTMISSGASEKSA